MMVGLTTVVKILQGQILRLYIIGRILMILKASKIMLKQMDTKALLFTKLLLISNKWAILYQKVILVIMLTLICGSMILLFLLQIM